MNELMRVPSFEEAKSLAKILSTSALVPDALRGKEADILFTVMTGAEMGLGPMTSLRTFEVINGKVGMKAEAMVAHVRSHPSVEYIRCLESTTKTATWVSKLKSDPSPQKTTFAWEEAVQAGLAGQEMYKKWPQRMLMWRAASAHCKANHSDIVLGLYSTEEIESFAQDVTPRAVAVTPQNEAQMLASLQGSIDAVAPKPRLLQVANEPATPDYGPDGAPLSERAKLEVAVEEAGDETALNALVERVQKLQTADKAELRKRWCARRDKLKAQAISSTVGAPAQGAAP
jgi:hypothetical protein